jgi:hypothetical protein
VIGYTVLSASIRAPICWWRWWPRRRWVGDASAITGLLYFASAAGHSMGPLVLGKAFDVDGNYRARLESLALIIATGALAT